MAIPDVLVTLRFRLVVEILLRNCGLRLKFRRLSRLSRLFRIRIFLLFPRFSFLCIVCSFPLVRSTPCFPLADSADSCRAKSRLDEELYRDETKANERERSVANDRGYGITYLQIDVQTDRRPSVEGIAAGLAGPRLARVPGQLVAAILAGQEKKERILTSSNRPARDYYVNPSRAFPHLAFETLSGTAKQTARAKVTFIRDERNVVVSN